MVAYSSIDHEPRESNEHHSRTDHKHSDRHLEPRSDPLEPSASRSRYSGAGTVRGGFNEFDAKLVDGKLEGSAKVASVSFDEPRTRRPPPVARLLRRRAVPRSSRFASKTIERNGDDVTIDGEPHASRRDEARHDHRNGRRPDAGCRRVPGRSSGSRFDLETTVDRREFGIDWNRDLPSGDPALGNDVKITANLALVQA